MDIPSLLNELQVKVAVLETKLDIIIKLIFGALAIILSDFVWRVIKMIGDRTGIRSRGRKKKSK
jgi:hypothetical protein